MKELQKKISKDYLEEGNYLTTSSGEIYFEIFKTTNDTKKIFKCSTCAKSFKEKGNLKIHSRIHTGERPFICNYEGCHKSFVTLGNLNSHISNHTGIKQYKCSKELCDKKYYCLSRLRIHERTHADYRPYECPWDNCGKKFNEKGNLKTHCRIHTGEKPFKCNYLGCLKAFKAKGHLKDHLKIHSTLRKYNCDQCNQSFTRLSVFKVHQNSHMNSNKNINSKNDEVSNQILLNKNLMEDNLQILPVNEEIFERNGSSLKTKKEENRNVEVNEEINPPVNQNSAKKFCSSLETQNENFCLTSPTIPEKTNIFNNNLMKNLLAHYLFYQTQIPSLVNINNNYSTTLYLKYVLENTKNNLVSKLISLSLRNNIPIKNLLILVIKYINDKQDFIYNYDTELLMHLFSMKSNINMANTESSNIKMNFLNILSNLVFGVDILT